MWWSHGGDVHAWKRFAWKASRFSLLCSISEIKDILLVTTLAHVVFGGVGVSYLWGSAKKPRMTWGTLLIFLSTAMSKGSLIRNFIRTSSPKWYKACDGSQSSLYMGQRELGSTTDRSTLKKPREQGLSKGWVLNTLVPPLWELGSIARGSSYKHALEWWEPCSTTGRQTLVGSFGGYIDAFPCLDRDVAWNG